MSEDLTFKEHNKVAVATARKLTGWMTRTFQTSNDINEVNFQDTNSL